MALSKQALTVNTGAPEKTKADLKATMDGTREQSSPLAIESSPALSGATFNPGKANVTHVIVHQ